LDHAEESEAARQPEGRQKGYAEASAAVRDC
jgi:hypothetical protein